MNLIIYLEMIMKLQEKLDTLVDKYLYSFEIFARKEKLMKCKKSTVGRLNNEEIVAYNVKFENGFEVEILNLGGVITKIITPNKDNNLENIVLAYEDINDYIENPYYYGAIIGRTAGRINEGKIVIDDKEYELNKNYGVHQGHGGNQGFNHRIWQVKVEENKNYVTLNLSTLSKDMEENYPGNLNINVIFNIYENYKIEEIYKAKSDKTTLVNMTNHTYFNLSGNIKEPVTDSYLKLGSDCILELNETYVPTGKKIDVTKTPFDFRKLKLIGRDIDANHEQIKIGNGYDHAFLLNNDKKIYLEDKKSKRNMTIETNQDCVVVYTMNWEHEKMTYTGEVPPIRHGICFETQHPPIGENMCFIKESLLNKDEEYMQKTVYKFSTSK